MAISNPFLRTCVGNCHIFQGFLGDANFLLFGLLLFGLTQSKHQLSHDESCGFRDSWETQRLKEVRYLLHVNNDCFMGGMKSECLGRELERCVRTETTSKKPGMVIFLMTLLVALIVITGIKNRLRMTFNDWIWLGVSTVTTHSAHQWTWLWLWF